MIGAALKCCGKLIKIFEKFNRFLSSFTIKVEASKKPGGYVNMNDNRINEKIVDASKTIFSYCMAKTPNREEAEDLCQDILCELVKSAEKLRNPEAFYGFMWATAGNVYKQWCRKHSQSKTCELTEDLASEETFGDEEDTDLFLLRRELSLLSEKYRQATILYYVKQKSCQEISQILSISESMVKYLLFKARKILKEGMQMERKLGTLSYAPKSLVPLYYGTGPNRFWDFMRSKVRQNIVHACYNDSLTAEQISLETGIPLPYLEDDIRALVEKEILIQEGTHHKANVIVIETDCMEEIWRSAIGYEEQIADRIEAFLETKLMDFRQIGFVGADFSENTLRWQLAALVLEAVSLWEMEHSGLTNDEELPLTAWGDHAYTWLMEEELTQKNTIFNTSQVSSAQGDQMCFYDYVPVPKGSHRDFYGNPRYVNIFCDIARGNVEHFSEYDLEVAAELVRKGYVRKDGEHYRAAVPVFSKGQYEDALKAAKEFVFTELDDLVCGLIRSNAGILREHTPKYLKGQVAGIANRITFVMAACIPVRMLAERNVLHTNWHPLEMPTIHLVLNQ